MYSQFGQNPYFQRLAQMENNYSQNFQMPQTLQQFQKQPPSVQCFSVNKKSDMEGMQIQPNAMYIGLNANEKEIYVRKWNNDGLIEFETYNLKDENKKEDQKSNEEINKILERLAIIEEKINSRRPFQTVRERKDESNNE